MGFAGFQSDSSLAKHLPFVLPTKKGSWPRFPDPALSGLWHLSQVEEKGKRKKAGEEARS